MQETLALIERAHQGDKAARDLLFEQNTGLVISVARRFLGRGVELEDLIQIGSIGLLKAVDKFDCTQDVRLSTYAVPMIAGEIRRFLRDDGLVKVSRTLKESQYHIHLLQEKLERELGREPTVQELCAQSGLPLEELILAMESKAEVESLQKTVYQGEGQELSLLDKLPEKRNAQEELLNKLFLEELLKTLDERETCLIRLRFFQDKTQTEVAKEFGISQVQVSRMEKRILKKLREKSG
ncbi:MAG: SigB/SigF/SigG family RNA polymerase sigma factor [Blautia sp.]|nr:SigB/SigF/SigG family RNA polymerase sigma factor [Blautia sp.]